ncbi:MULTISPECIES: hypothetical protein [unclassified Rhizobium]|uniref:hypothetical protein n=1 Tax=unclassified Rhizobium TaxID=2613769 RepID=UPI003802A525
MSALGRPHNLREIIVHQPPAFLEKAGRQASGRGDGFFGRFVHGAMVARAFAETVQSARSYSGKSGRLSSRNVVIACAAVNMDNNYGRRMQLWRRLISDPRGRRLEMRQSLVEVKFAFANLRSTYGLQV